MFRLCKNECAIYKPDDGLIVVVITLRKAVLINFKQGDVSMFIIVLLFLLSVVSAIVSAWLAGREKKRRKHALYFAIASGAMQILALFLSIVFRHGFWMASLAVLVADACICLPNLFFAKHKNLLQKLERQKKLIYGLSFSTAVVLLFEAFFCNFGSYALAFPMAPKEQELSISEAIVDGSPYGLDAAVVNAGESLVLHFDGIDDEVRTIYADISLSDATENTVNISYTDETSEANLRGGVHLNYINGNESSKYITCSLFGTVDQLEFSINADSDSSVIVSQLRINSVIPFEFSWTRVLVFLALLYFLVILAYAPRMKLSCGKSRLFTYGAVFLTWEFLLLGVLLFLLRGTDTVVEFLRNPDTNQINQELVDAFRAGQVNLLSEPSEELLELSNPYDDSLRSGIGFAWDHLLFEGKYYSYYGIGTVLTLFLPYHLITGTYLSSLWATLFYSLIGITFLSLSYCTLVKRYFPKTPNGIALSGLIIVQATSFVWYCITIGNFYELAQVSGFAFLIAGMFFLLRAGVLGKGKVSKVNICVATTLFSIAVLCRAALALYCLVSLLFLYAGVRKIIRTAPEPTFRANRKPVIQFLLAACLPYVLIGSVQMIYNYLRFGSILDFGIEYTLTIYDYQHIQFHLPLVLIAIYNYLFTVPKINTVFPFITSNYDSLNVNGYYFLAGFSATGLIFRAVPVLGYVFGPRAYRNIGKKPERNLITAIIICGCLIVPLIQMAMIWEYGYTPRYAVDFAWQMLFGAFVILFIVHRSASKPIQRVLYAVFALSAVASVFINAALTYEFVLDYGNTYQTIPTEIRSAMLSFGRLFEFWNIM